MEVLAVLAALLCIDTPVYGAKGCNAFRHLENGQTFFRYGGLLVMFRCHPGYKLHGYKTNSCVSGHWSRDIPVCVGSGCSTPGPLIHGTSAVNDDGSWAVFTCNSGFRLHGPSRLYCQGRTWNSSKPVCKQSDMMSSVSAVNGPKPNVDPNLQAAVAVNTQHQFHGTVTNNPLEKTNIKSGSLPLTLTQTSGTESVKKTNPQVQQSIRVSDFTVKLGVPKRRHHETEEATKPQGPETGTQSDGSEVKATPVFASRWQKSTPVSPTVSSVSRTERSTGSSSETQTPTIAAATDSFERSLPTAPPSPTIHTKPTLLKFGSEKALTAPGDVIPPGDNATESGFQFYPQSGSGSGSADKQKPVENSAQSFFTSASFTSFSSASSALTSSSPHASFSASHLGSTLSNMKTQTPDVGLPPNASSTAEPRSLWTGYFKMSSTPKPPLGDWRPRGHPECPYPPVPDHGTFYLHYVENPGPTEYRHYIQYACYAGYVLAGGDALRYCRRGGSWSGITPVCLEMTPCSVNNGGCSQLCSHSQYYNQSGQQTRIRTQCHCRPGFTLLDDGQTCRDLDECSEGQPQCQQRCINTFGSFMCLCDDGYQPTQNQTSCSDVDECLLPAAVTGCVFGCVNTAGSFHCRCPPGYSLHSEDSHCQDIDECAGNQGLGPCVERCHNSPGSYRCSCGYGRTLAGDGHGCIAECPPGYRKQATTPWNSTVQALREECVDINECQEEACEWQCVNLPGSYRCICPRGYTLQDDGRHCKDINECSRKNGGCSHLCLNQRGGHKCACPASHRLSSYSWKKCVPRTTATAG